MKKYSYILLLALVLGGCKTTEANYKAAYEKAKSKGESTAIDKEVYDRIRNEEGPSVMTFGNVTFPAKGVRLSVVELPEMKTGVIDRFSVCNGRFRQTFNAKSMARRLQENGFPDAFVAKDREGAYYVICASVSNPEEAKQLLDSAIEKGNGAVAPFPYIIVK